MESIKYAENKLGAKMGTPHALPKEHAFAPVKYDVEELSQKDQKMLHKQIAGIESDKGMDAGDCDIGDTECQHKSTAGITKPADETKIQTYSNLRMKDDKKPDTQPA